jgi:SAM-dependent methyltransferase
MKVPIKVTEYPKSETSKCRERLAVFCQGVGLDIGYGGDPIVSTAITVDLPAGTYGFSFGDHPQNIRGDGTNLYWFSDKSLDYVYASHLLEDFSAERIPIIVQEWLRVIKPGGYLVIYCPDEQVYREYCKKQGTIPNRSHKNDQFGLNFLLELIKDIKIDFDIVHSLRLDDSYGFDLVLRRAGLLEQVRLDRLKRF